MYIAEPVSVTLRRRWSDDEAKAAVGAGGGALLISLACVEDSCLRCPMPFTGPNCSLERTCVWYDRVVDVWRGNGISLDTNRSTTTHSTCRYELERDPGRQLQEIPFGLPTFNVLVTVVRAQQLNQRKVTQGSLSVPRHGTSMWRLLRAYTTTAPTDPVCSTCLSAPLSPIYTAIRWE